MKISRVCSIRSRHGAEAESVVEGAQGQIVVAHKHKRLNALAEADHIYNEQAAGAAPAPAGAADSAVRSTRSLIIQKQYYVQHGGLIIWIH